VGKVMVFWPMRQIYLDFNATTPIDQRVAESMRAAMNDGYGNPSSPHWAGAPAKRMVEASRKRVASLLSSSWIERPADRLSEDRIAADHALIKVASPGNGSPAQQVGSCDLLHGS
jgi:hypothetical protein